MAKIPATNTLSASERKVSSDLEQAFRKAVTYPLERAKSLGMTPGELQPWVLEEATSGAIVSDPRGIT